MGVVCVSLVPSLCFPVAVLCVCCDGPCLSLRLVRELCLLQWPVTPAATEQVCFNKGWSQLFWNSVETVGFYTCWFYYSLVGACALLVKVEPCSHAWALGGFLSAAMHVSAIGWGG